MYIDLHIHINTIIGSILLLVALVDLGFLIFFWQYLKTVTIWAYLGFITGAMLFVGGNAISFLLIGGEITTIQKFTYLGGTLLTSSFLVFAFSFPYPVHKIINTIKYYPFIAVPIFSYMLFGTHFFLPPRSIFLDGNLMTTIHTTGLTIWTIFFLVSWAVAATALIHRYRQKHTTSKQRIYYLLIGIGISSIIGISTDVIMPYFAVNYYAWLGPFFSVVWMWFTVKAVRA